MQQGGIYLNKRRKTKQLNSVLLAGKKENKKNDLIKFDTVEQTER